MMCFGPPSSTTGPLIGLATMPEPFRLKTILQPRGPAAAVILTDEQVAEIGQGAKTPPVKVTVNGGHTFGGRIGRMGGESMLGFNKVTREAAGVEAGDEIEVEIVLDDAPREVEVPDDLKAALAADPAAAKAFEALAYSHRKEWARWVAEAKRPETREKRLAETVARVGAGETRR
jgi:hypothetical protein